MKNFNNKYTIRDFIDKNKWSNVYMAVNKETNKKVILNILLNTQGNEESLPKFKEEINLLKDINSPNIISINDMSTYINKGKTYYYIESENFEGLTLDELIRINKLHEEQCLQIIMDVINGVKEFNNQKINFGNLTTENIIINGGGVVKIDTLSFINNHKGHINYNLYSSKRFDPREDVHTIGCILYNMITGEQLFDREKLKYLDKGICDILEKSTNKKNILKHKYKNLDEFLNDIDLYLYGEEESNHSVINIENSVINFEKIHKLKSSPKIKKYITIACGAVILLCTTAFAAQNIINRKSENVATTNISEDIDKTEEKATDKTQKITPIEENLITPKNTAKVKKEKVTTKNNDDNMNNKKDDNKNINVQNNNVQHNNENKNNGNHNKVEKLDKEDTNNDNLDKNDNNTEQNPNPNKEDNNSNTEENKGEEKPDNNSSNEEKPDQKPDNNQPNHDKNEDKDNNHNKDNINNNEANDTENK